MESREQATERTRSAEGSLEIDASPERVWEALTTAEDLERWFPLEARVEPGVGGSVWLSWKNEYAATSEIVEWEPARVLAYSWGWSPDSPPQVTRFEIEGRGGRTRLRVVTSGFPAGATWDDWVEGTRLGWSFELRGLRQYLERHDGEERHVVYLRRVARLTREETARRLFGPGGLASHGPAGVPFDEGEPTQYACELDGGGLFRLSMNEPSPGSDERAVVVWAQAWGEGAARRMALLGREWRERLEGALPEGETLAG